MNEVCQGKDKMLVARELEIAAKERALETMEGKVVSLVEQCASLRGELAKKSEVIHSQNMDIQRLQVIDFLHHYRYLTRSRSIYA